MLSGGADWPMHRPALHASCRTAQVIASGEERLRDMMYLDGRSNRYSTGDPLRYEKQMIDEWFSKKIAPKRVGIS